MQTDSQRLEPILEALVALDWIGQLSETQGREAASRFVLLVDPQQTPLQPLVQSLLLPHGPATQNLWKNDRWPACSLCEVL